jgi:hypothetical protein
MRSARWRDFGRSAPGPVAPPSQQGSNDARTLLITGWDKGFSSDVKNPYIGAVAGTRPTVARNKDGSDYASAVASFRDADGKAEPAL